MRFAFTLITVVYAQLAMASAFPKVDADLKNYDDHIAEMNATFAHVPAEPSSKEWVKAKLQHMFDVDQYMRKYMMISYDHRYSDEEKAEFFKEFANRFQAIDRANTADLKALLKIHHWFTISEFGEVADNNAWLLVQHADLDPDFQREVLRILEPLVATGETRPSNFAYLFDRVAASWSDLSKQVPQRYGTQGMCKGPGVWEPIPLEDPENLDRRRASVGLGPEAEYIAQFKDICR